MAMMSGNVDPALVEAGLAGNNSAFNYPQMYATTSNAEAMPNEYDLRVNIFNIFLSDFFTKFVRLLKAKSLIHFP